MTRQLFEYHPLLAYRFIPGLKTRVPHESGGYLVRVNGSGFRCNHEFVKEKPAGVRRVLLFGDSFTAGDGVSNGERFGDRLEKLIPDLQVYNFGLPSAGPDQHYLAYQEFARGISHDLMVIAVLVENVRRVVAAFRAYVDETGQQKLYAKPYFELVSGQLALRNVPPARKPLTEEELAEEDRGRIDRGGRLQVVRELVSKLGLRELAQKVTRYQPVPEYDSADNPDWLLLKEILKQWVQGHDRPVLLMPLPLSQHIEETSDARPYQERFVELAREARCHYHDPLPDLLCYPATERRQFRFSKDIHLTPLGHAAIAGSLQPVIERLLPALPSTH
jgi:carbamoyltransferase